MNASVTYRPESGNWDLTAGGTKLTGERHLVTGQPEIAGGQVYGTYSRPVEWYAGLGFEL